MSPQSSQGQLNIERTQPGPVRELAMKFDKDTIVSPRVSAKGVQSFMTPPQSPAVFRAVQSRSMPRETFMTPLQSPKVNLVTERAAKFGIQTKPGKRPSFIQKDPNNPFNNSLLWKTDDQILLDEPEVPKQESMPELKVEDVVDFEAESIQNAQEDKSFKNNDDNTSITAPSDDSSFTATNDDSAVRDDASPFTEHDSLRQVDTQKEKKKKKDKKEKKESKKSKKKHNETDKKKRSKSKDKRRKSLTNRTHASWDFGKPKKIDLPPVTSTTIYAAISIQRMMRGWWSRLHFRIQLLTYRLENKERLTSAALEKVWIENQEKKDRFYEILKGKIDRRQERELEKTVTCRQEGQQIIEFLKKDNKKIREDTDRLKREIKEQKTQHARLEMTSDQIARNMKVLQVYAERFQESHEQLIQVEPVFKAKAVGLEDANEQAKAYCDTEHICKLKYLRTMEKIVMMVQDRCTNPKLVDLVVDLMLSIELDQNDGR